MSQTVEEIAAELAAVRAALLAIAGGAQAATVNGQSYTRADHRALAEREKDLMARLAAADTPGLFAVSRNRFRPA